MTRGGEDSEIIVVDASVIVALVASRATGTSRIAARISAGDLHGPSLLPTEIDSALRGLERGGVLTTVQADAARARAREIPIDLWPWQLIGDRAWELRQNLTSYDAAYVALAERLDVPLLTGDARLARAARGVCDVEVVDVG